MLHIHPQTEQYFEVNKNGQYYTSASIYRNTQCSPSVLAQLKGGVLSIELQSEYSEEHNTDTMSEDIVHLKRALNIIIAHLGLKVESVRNKSDSAFKLTKYTLSVLN